jgi:hypothetical protein
MSKLLTRNEFRNGVFERDNHKCVICKTVAADAHHIIERRLFDDGGYYLDNGASLCPDCHIEAEKTVLSPNRIREAAGIKSVVLPSHFYDDQEYDKWGNPVLANGQRLKGELFFDISVQRILTEGGVLGYFTKYVKYPRTHHLPWSLGMHDDDRMHETTEQWDGKHIVITMKMDGENTTMYSDHIHARSIESKKHPSRSWVKNFWSTIAHDIPEDWRICGENLFAKHSIGYDNLKSYFYGFSIWTETNYCLDWDATKIWFELLGIKPVEVIYDGIYDETLISKLHKRLDFDKNEGYVLRTRDGFSYGEFRKNVGKFVRPDHIKTTQHWMHGQAMEINKVL